MKNLAVYYDYLVIVAKKNLPNSLHLFAEDMVQEGFYKALKNKSAFDDKKGKVNTWLATIVKNTCTDFLRKKANQEMRLDFAMEHFSDFEEQIFDTKVDLRHFLGLLPEKYHRIIVLKYFFKMTAKEIAHILEIKANQVPVLAARGIQKMKNSMGKREGLF